MRYPLYQLAIALVAALLASPPAARGSTVALTFNDLPMFGIRMPWYRG